MPFEACDSCMKKVVKNIVARQTLLFSDAKLWCVPQTGFPEATDTRERNKGGLTHCAASQPLSIALALPASLGPVCRFPALPGGA